MFYATNVFFTYCSFFVHHKADKFISRDIHIEFFSWYTYIRSLNTTVRFLHFFLVFHRSFRTKQNDIFLALEEKIHFSTLSLFTIYSFRFIQS